MLAAMKPSTRTSDHSSPVPATPAMVFPWGWILPIIGACAVVMTGHMLGGAWLSQSSMGLPAGLWIVLVVGAVSWLASRKPGAAPVVTLRAETSEEAPRETRRPARDTLARPAAARETRTEVRAEAQTETRIAAPAPQPVTTPEPASTVSAEAPAAQAAPAGESLVASEECATPPAPSLHVTWPQDAARSTGLTILSRAASIFESPDGSEPRWAESLSGWLDAGRAPARALRVGLMLDEWAAGRLADDTRRDIDWLVATGASATDSLRAQNLDAIVTADDENLIVRTREHASREAGWFDWGAQRPMTYFSIFPLRLDTSRVTLSGAMDLVDDGDEALTLTRRVIRLAALFSRLPARLSLADRLGGRAAIYRGQSGADLAGGALREMASLLASDHSRVARIAARVASAWVATAPDTMSDAERCALCDRVAAAAGDEAEVMLRTAAVRLAMLDDRLGIDALIRADRMVRQRGTLDGLDHIKLLQAELEHGAYGDMTLGRVAAGICLACAATPADRIAFLKDDLLEDMRFSHYLVGRDKEHAILIDVFRQLERHRRADVYGLPAAA